jgi:hypothetical protein
MEAWPTSSAIHHSSFRIHRFPDQAAAKILFLTFPIMSA